MMTMRPPQQGHLSASALSGVVSIVGAAVASSSRACDVLSTTGAGKEPVMADAMEPFGQDMKKETADEFVGRQRHGLVAAWPFDPVVLVFEGDAARVGSNQSAVGDGDAVGVA